MAKLPDLRSKHRLPPCNQSTRSWAGLVGIVATAGCSFVYLPAPDLTRRMEPVDLSTVAVLVGSVTQSDPQLPARNPYSEVQFSFDSVTGGRRFSLYNARLGIHHLTEPAADEGLEAEHGRLFAVPLEPGTYALRKISMSFQSRVEIVLPDLPRVTVTAGEVVYIGNLEVKNCYSAYLRPDGQHVRQTVAGGFPMVTDRSARDLNLLRASYPALRDVAIDVRVLDVVDVFPQASRELSRACSFELGNQRGASLGE